MPPSVWDRKGEGENLYHQHNQMLHSTEVITVFELKGINEFVEDKQNDTIHYMRDIFLDYQVHETQVINKVSQVNNGCVCFQARKEYKEEARQLIDWFLKQYLAAMQSPEQEKFLVNSRFPHRVDKPTIPPAMTSYLSSISQLQYNPQDDNTREATMTPPDRTPTTRSYSSVVTPTPTTPIDPPSTMPTISDLTSTDDKFASLMAHMDSMQKEIKENQQSVNTWQTNVETHLQSLDNKLLQMAQQMITTTADVKAMLESMKTLQQSQAQLAETLTRTSCNLSALSHPSRSREKPTRTTLIPWILI